MRIWMHDPAAAWGFLRHPPGWLLVILWLSFAYVIFRTLAVSLLRSQIMQAWILARLHAIRMPLYEVITLAVHGHDTKRIVRCCIMVGEANVDVSRERIAAHEAAGGDPETVVMAIVAAEHAGLSLTPDELFQSDLDGANPLAMVEELSAEKREEPIAGPAD